MTRAEHLQWCKDRALEYVKVGNLQEAMASMMSDLRKHPETENHTGVQLGLAILMGGTYGKSQVEEYIKGFN